MASQANWDSLGSSNAEPANHPQAAHRSFLKELSTQPVKSVTIFSGRMVSPRVRARTGQVRKLPWCLYLPGFCIHSSPGALGEELHHVVPKFPRSLIFHPFVEPPIHDHPAVRAPVPSDKFPSPLIMRAPIPIIAGQALPDLAKLINDDKAFENTSTSVAASQMRNALNNLADTVTDPEEKKVWFTPVPP
jgi:hypothetical protein